MEDYRRFKWFYTSSGKLVVGGKSAGQNDELLKEIKKIGKERIIMHTSHHGSPFCVIISEINNVTKKDLEECAIFTGCFSRAWKEGKGKTEIHIFKMSQVEKIKGMKTGAWRVNNEVERTKVDLKLVLVKQKKVYRAVPEKTVKKKNILIKFCPGNVDKSKMIGKIRKLLGDEKVSNDELLAALPAGGVRICK